MKILKIIFFVFGGLTITYFGAKAFRNISVVDKTTEIKTEHFVISYYGVYENEAQETAETLEANYNRIRKDLNDPVHEIIRVFVYPTQTDFNKGTRLLKSSANGTSRGPNEFHFLWTNWFNSIFPDDPIKTAVHEFTHCIQLNILIKKELEEMTELNKDQFDKFFEEKFAKKYPQWFWEAICDYEAGVVNTLSVTYGIRKNPTLKDLNNSNQIYNVGYTIIEYIVEKWGRDKLPILVTSYVDMEAILGVSESDFEKGWIEFVNEKY